MAKCQICKENGVKTILDAGPQALCNRFTADPDGRQYMHPLVLGQCAACGLIQFTSPVSENEVRPRFDWIKYNEPEGHLDDLADLIRNLPGVNANTSVLGIGAKDGTLVTRLTARGLKAAETTDNADIVIARHAYEHAISTGDFIKKLERIVNPGGYIVFEVPDSTQALGSQDYTMLWEEHVLYFTPATFKNSFGYFNLTLAKYKLYPYPAENVLIGITSPCPLPPEGGEDKGEGGKIKSQLEKELKSGDFYGGHFAGYSQSVRQYLKEYKEKGKRIAVFGAGHLSCMYINLMKIKEYIDFVVDDDPNKEGLYMPGSGLGIRPSDALVKENIGLCLLGLRPDVEDKIINKNRRYVERGGSFASIFPASKKRLNLMAYMEGPVR